MNRSDNEAPLKKLHCGETDWRDRSEEEMTTGETIREKLTDLLFGFACSPLDRCRENHPASAPNPRVVRLLTCRLTASVPRGGSRIDYKRPSAASAIASGLRRPVAIG